MNYGQFLTTRNIFIVAIAIALIGFLSVHRYYAEIGFLPNIMYDKIFFTDECTSEYLPDPDGCFSLAYKWLLAADIFLASAALIARRHISN